ncbi:MAG TPA: hypothetical protein VG754_01380 [Verrucomicrobiae bacterium]|nr:hypothetical protein [Verrucomicrobiae bacterium]
MKTLKLTWTIARGIASVLFAVATSPFAGFTALFFALFMGVALALVLGLGFHTQLLWKLALPLLILSAVLAFRIGLPRMPAVSGPTVYDKAEYHYDGDDYPKGLARRHAFVHTGMFVGWLIEHDMIVTDFLDETVGFKERRITGAKIYKAWDGTLISDMLTEEGNRFAAHYFDFERGQFLDDYQEALASGLPSFYHVADTWDNFDIIKKKIDQRYETWKRDKVA